MTWIGCILLLGVCSVSYGLAVIGYQLSRISNILWRWEEK